MNVLGNSNDDSGSLYVVATPIGNLADMTRRAADVLRCVAIVACEDTRRCRRLLQHIDARPDRLVALHDHNETVVSEALTRSLEQGQDVALVSDAGTPLVCDPGFELVRAAFSKRIRVVPVPGPSALATALSVSPIPAQRFRFEGFLPARRTQRRRVLSALLRSDVAVVMFEAPHRMRGMLTDLVALGAAGREIVICRELTKLFESISYMTVAEALDALAAKNEFRGEFVCVLAPTSTDIANIDHVVEVLSEELGPAQAARLAAKLTGKSKAGLYAQALSLKRE
ncbi:MAG: 16S rRNA (cytidine(1402)-2'-O)-methyltransferase [Gammaproteobacteria bacterium]|nr:16S rRNA (cytidine(1402)-2'-O)-methyltransferase [Gammaproteobacteria bacterium]